jgi:hypothetical protein
VEGARAEDQSNNADAEIIVTLRKKVQILSESLSVAESEIKRLNGAVALRDGELTRNARSIGANNGDEFGESAGRIERMIAADKANQRIIDQLNSQV